MSSLVGDMSISSTGVVVVVFVLDFSALTNCSGRSQMADGCCSVSTSSKHGISSSALSSEKSVASSVGCVDEARHRLLLLFHHLLSLLFLLPGFFIQHVARGRWQAGVDSQTKKTPLRSRQIHPTQRSLCSSTVVEP